ncbi:patatin-like phospholipase family protein [Rufibacter aurantiacus]|uniref:patatin-like phospholipase family protein n=1 Tax=Rufibacter aurantiacus TaxID=2817374 RepID=UPI001B30CCAB|nr:patatin-like phospholipase family protein [Rufibacter aurantiacus]
MNLHADTNKRPGTQNLSVLEMRIEQFTTENGLVQSTLTQLRERVKDKTFSDVVDGEGHQYVDLVMEGGGMLGIALVGYVYVLEQMGIRFLRLGGTSAGSINALLMAAAGPKYQPASDWILQIMANKNFYDFVDGDSDARDFIEAWVEGSGLVKLTWKGAQVIDNLRNDFGLNPGRHFHEWLTAQLKVKGVDTWGKLEALRVQGNERLIHRDGTPYISDSAGRLALVAADVTTQTKVDFPAMANLYWANPSQVNPADFVRASMAIPLFYQPFVVRNLPKGLAALDRWNKVGYTGNVPEEVYFIDGGINSNFPIDLFHNHNKVPQAPTFGVQLGVDRDEPRRIKTVTNLIGAIFDSARHVHDYDFIARNPDYRHLVAFLDTDEFTWFDFRMPDAQKLRLFEVGVKGAADFLIRFDWVKYKELRQTMVALKQKSDNMLAKANTKALIHGHLKDHPDLDSSHAPGA